GAPYSVLEFLVVAKAHRLLRNPKLSVPARSTHLPRARSRERVTKGALTTARMPSSSRAVCALLIVQICTEAAPVPISGRLFAPLVISSVGEHDALCAGGARS